MISNDIIRQSAHKQMLEALPKQCQLSRFASPWTYYLYRAFKFVMLITPLLACRKWRGEKTGTMTRVGVCRNKNKKHPGGTAKAGVDLGSSINAEWTSALMKNVWTHEWLWNHEFKYCILFSEVNFPRVWATSIQYLSPASSSLGRGCRRCPSPAITCERCGTPWTNHKSKFEQVWAPLDNNNK